MAKKTVFHTTALGNGDKIIRSGWEVTSKIFRGQLYGRGIYFWEYEKDAHTFGKIYFPNGYEIISEDIPYRNILKYDAGKRNPRNYDADSFARGMITRGYELLEIANAYMENSTMRQAKGKAYVWLVDTNIPFKTIT